MHVGSSVLGYDIYMSIYWVHISVRSEMMWSIYEIIHGRYELNKLTSLPMCGFIVQLVEQRTGNAEVTGSNPVEALIFFVQASSFQLLKLENLLRWSFFTFIYNRSSKMNYFIYTSQKLCVRRNLHTAADHLRYILRNVASYWVLDGKVNLWRKIVLFIVKKRNKQIYVCYILCSRVLLKRSRLVQQYTSNIARTSDITVSQVVLFVCFSTFF